MAKCFYKFMYKILNNCFSSVSYGPWIGLRDINDNGTFVWLNGEVLEEGGILWAAGHKLDN